MISIEKIPENIAKAIRNFIHFRVSRGFLTKKQVAGFIKEDVTEGAMKHILLFIGLLSLLSYTGSAQQIVDDGKVTRREFRLKSRQLPPKDRKVRLENWKYEQGVARAKRKEQRAGRNPQKQKDVKVQRRFPVILSKENRKKEKQNTHARKIIY